MVKLISILAVMILLNVFVLFILQSETICQKPQVKSTTGYKSNASGKFLYTIFSSCYMQMFIFFCKLLVGCSLLLLIFSLHCEVNQNLGQSARLRKSWVWRKDISHTVLLSLQFTICYPYW